MLKIGLEVHIYPKTKSKLFCRCSTNLEEKPNENLCPVCSGQPGAKPMLVNKKAVEQLLKLGLVLKSKIQRSLIFRRKHYFYPDLPNNFQRTSPLVTFG